MPRILFIFLFFSNFALANEINLFTSRHYESDSKIYKKFTNETGIKVNVVWKIKSFRKRIIEEGKKVKLIYYFSRCWSFALGGK